MDYMDDNVFAEIDIEPAGHYDEKTADLLQRSKVMHPGWAQSILPPESAVLYQSYNLKPVSRAQPVIPRAADPVREKFYEMRALASKRPFPGNDSELFYRQAKFMEDFTDDFEGDAKFNMYFPCYSRMGYDFLRTYFTWRTKARSGEIRDTSLSYVFLYIYELLSGIGVKDPAEGLDKLMGIWEAFSGQHSAIRHYLPEWLKDYHVFYELPHSFFDFVHKHGLQMHYSLTLLFDTQIQGQLALWNTLSGYDITKSGFYKNGNEELLAKCFDAVLAALRRFCEEKGARIEDLLIYSISRRSPWQPFKNALSGSKAPQNDREAYISKYERYYCKNGQWTANLPVYYSSQKDFIGYLLKKTEACLRAATNYKYKLAAEMRPGNKPFRELQRLAAKRAELDRIIEKAVTDFYTEINRVVVTVDHRSLERIREEALETQEQLVVEDAEQAVMTEDSTMHNSNEPVTLSFSDGWKALKTSLTDIERDALNITLAGGDIKAFTAEKGIMPEVLFDSINGKASDCIGDSILELSDEAYVFEEYKDDILNIL